MINYAPVGIVLCHEISPEGKLSSETLARLNAGIELYKNGKVKKLIFSGGRIDGNSFSVAEKMRDYVKTKINSDYFLEEISLDTAGQLIFIKEGIIDPLNIKKFYVITNSWHTPKTKVMINRLFNSEYEVEFVEVEKDKSPHKKSEDFPKIQIFLKTFKNFENEKQSLVEYLLENHPWYFGKYPEGNFNKEYFLEKFMELKEKNE